jgi:hypothetical protein
MGKNRMCWPPDARARYRSHTRMPSTTRASLLPHSAHGPGVGSSPASLSRQTRRSSVAADRTTRREWNSSGSGTMTARPHEHLSGRAPTSGRTGNVLPHSQTTP